MIRIIRTLHMAVEAAIQVGNVSLGKQYCEEALRLARQVGEPNRIVDLLHDLGFLYWHLLQFEAIGQLIMGLAAFSESLEEPQIRANAEFYLGRLLYFYGLFPESISTLERALPQLRSLGYRWGAAFCNNYLGIDRLMIGDYARAETIFLALIQEAEQGPWPRLVAAGEVGAGLAVLLQGRSEQAVEHAREGARRYRELKHAAEVGMALGVLAMALEATGQPQAAKEALLEALHVPDNAHTIILSAPALMSLLAHRGHIEAALQMHRVGLKLLHYKNSRCYADLIGDEMDAQWEKLPEDRQAEIDASISQHNLYSIVREVRSLLEAG